MYKKRMNRDRIFLITVSILVILTIVLAAFSLNRLGGATINKPAIFEFKLRIFSEHFLTGFYVPLIVVFFAYLTITLFVLLSKSRFNWVSDNSDSIIFKSLIAGSFINISFEVWWQFFRSPNPDSWAQTIYLVLGVIVCWVYAIKIKLFD